MSGRPPLIYLIAGEASGDQLGAGLMRALGTATGGAVRFAGVGGVAMQEAGLASLFPMHELSVMGLVEVLPRALGLLRRIRETAADIERQAPDAIVTIDAPSFAYRVLARLKRPGPPRLHYVAPQVWAWRPGRLSRYARVFDRFLALLPFEPGYFAARGMACSFVGHPAAAASLGDGPAFRTRHLLDPARPLLLLLPGSRRGEVGRLLPTFEATAARLAEDRPAPQFAILVAPGLEALLAEATRDWSAAPLLVAHGERADLFAAARGAIAASGTVSVELARAGVPHLVAYRVNALTAWLARRLIQVRYVNLVNLVLDHPTVPELLQQDCTPERIAGAARPLLVEGPARAAQLKAFATLIGQLAPAGATPPERAAAAILEALAKAKL